MKAGEWMWIFAFVGILLAFIGGLMWCGQRIPLDDIGPAIGFCGGMVIFLIFGLAGKLYEQGVKDTQDEAGADDKQDADS